MVHSFCWPHLEYFGVAAACEERKMEEQDWKFPGKNPSPMISCYDLIMKKMKKKKNGGKNKKQTQLWPGVEPGTSALMVRESFITRTRTTFIRK